MAIIQDDDKLQVDPNAPAEAPGAGPGGGAISGQGSSEVGAGGAQGNSAGVGAGGTGGWTNIQAYIDANKGDTGSAQALNKTVGDQFNQEKNAYTQDSQNFLGDATKQVNDSKIDNSTADALTKHATNSYQWGSPTQSLDYHGDVSKVQGALNNKYSGPTSYNYALGSKTQEYGNDLNDNGGFGQLMNHIYGEKAPGLNQGQAELQKQLDLNNTGLDDARKGLQGQYTDLGAGRDKAVADTTTGLNGLATQYGANQNALKDYLGKQASAYNTKEAQDEADARDAYQGAYTGGHSGLNNVFYGTANGGDFANTLADKGVWGDDGSNLTWQQLQNEQTIGAPGNRDMDYGNLAQGGNPVKYDDGRMANRSGLFDQNGLSLQNFYNDQEKTYQDTGDEDKRSFNAIQDFLNSGDARKEKGFDVGANYKQTGSAGVRRR